MGTPVKKCVKSPPHTRSPLYEVNVRMLWSASVPKRVHVLVSKRYTPGTVTVVAAKSWPPISASWLIGACVASPAVSVVPSQVANEVQLPVLAGTNAPPMQSTPLCTTSQLTDPVGLPGL